MSQETTNRELRTANPIAPRQLAALDLAAAEAELGRALIAESGLAGEPEVTGSESRRRSRRPRSALLALTGATALAAAAAVLLLVGGTSETPAPAYGAELVRFAESTPLLLLEGPGWRVENVDELNGGEGTMKFVTGKPASPEAHMSRNDRKRGIVPPSVRHERQRWVDLDWNNAKLSEALKFFYGPVDRVPGRKFTTTMPALGTKVHIDTRAESSPKYGGPGDHEMLAVWAEDGHVLELSTRVPDLAAFRERLGWLHRVDAQTWLDAMPAKVIKAADRGAAVREMLRGIPLPPGFDPAKISNQDLTTSRYEVGVAVGGGVACEWFSRWGEARANHDAATAQEAERALQGAGRWPVFREMSKEGAYPAVVVEYAEAMPRGRWYGRPLLPDVNRGLGCAEIGFPLHSGGER
jgi:hypothetical protein